MSRRAVSWLLVFAAAGALLLAFMLPPRVRHPVSPMMESAAEGVAGREVTKLKVDRERPVVVVFVLPDCPCSIEYEPYVKRLHQAYGDRVALMEVVAGDESAVEGWRKQYGVLYPVISDADGEIAREFGALRSAYTALVLDGKIAKLWPGYSGEMLRELGGWLARETKSEVKAMDLSGTPEVLASGCAL